MVRVGLVLLAVVLNSHATAQMPDGWRDLPPADFLTAKKSLGESTPSDQLAAIDQHAWDRFLTDAEFVSGGDLQTVLGMIDTFGPYRAAIDLATVESLRNQVDARLQGEPVALSSLELYELTDIAKSLNAVGRSMLDNVPLFKAWMAENDWRGMETHDVYNLFGFVNADAVDRTRFSARWSGELTPPRTGEYVFRQKRVYRGDDSRLVVTLDGTVVLDSRDASDGAYQSDPILLTGGIKASIVCELVHETGYIQYSVGAPMALLTWEGPGGSEELIPPSVLSHPGDDGAESPGLVGQYFGDTNFSDLRVTRSDASLDLIWSWPPTAAQETDASREVFAEITSRVLDDNYLSEIASSVESVVAIEFDRNLWRIAYRMTGAERQALVAALRRNPDVLARLSPEAIGRLFRGIYMLPSGDQIDLVGEWSLARPQPRSQPGWFPGFGEGSYQKLNTDFYWAIGHMMQGPYSGLADRLIDTYLEKPDGECNLSVAYIGVFAGDDRSVKSDVTDRIDSKLASTGLSGDQRATWLFARAFAKGVPARRGRTRPMRGVEHLREALLTADSDAYRRWTVGEMVSRLAACGYFDAAEEILAEHQGDFASAGGEHDQWVEDVARLKAFASERATDAATAAQNAYLAELRRRADLALARGDSATADNYSEQLRHLEQPGE